MDARRAGGSEWDEAYVEPQCLIICPGTSRGNHSRRELEEILTIHKKGMAQTGENHSGVELEI